MTAIYAWKEGSRFAASPGEAGPLLAQFSERGDTASDILREARKCAKDHWLRRETWVDRPDNELAEEQRLARARYLMRSITVMRPGDAEPRRLTFAVRQYTASPDDDDALAAYHDRAAVKDNPLLRRQMIHRFEQELRAILTGYGDLDEAAPVVVAIRQYFEGAGEHLAA